MSRFAFFVAFLAVLSWPAQAQIFSQGPPASATSPTADGRTHGVPASVLSPTPLPLLPGRGQVFAVGRHVRPFGTLHRHLVFVPVPLFYPVYGGYDQAYPSVADPSVQASDAAQAQSADSENGASSDEALRAAYLQGMRDALAHGQADSRYGQHYLDSRESAPPKPQAAPAAESKPAAAPEPDDSPAAVFIFKDGHKIETRNFAIMGKTLYDFSGSTLQKVQLDDLDAAATVKANDDRGITVKLQ